MSYTSTHDPVRFSLTKDFFQTKSGIRFGWRAHLFWDKKTSTGRPLEQYCPHVHRTETAAHLCGEKRVKA